MTEFAIGTKFTPRGKVKREYTVRDIWKTYNSAGELVRTRYVATFEVMGQTVTDYDIVATTIAMGLPQVPA